SRRRHTRSDRDWSSDVCSSDLVLGGSIDQSAPIVDVRAPVSGVITDQQVTNAAGVAGLNSPNPFTISDLSRVWILCDVYENDLRSEERRVGKGCRCCC